MLSDIIEIELFLLILKNNKRHISVLPGDVIMRGQ